MHRRQLLIAAGLFAAFEARAVSVRDEDWTDPVRARTLPVKWRWPAGDGPCAWIVHSHGLGGSREGGARWGEAWAAAGFAVLHLQHPGSDREVARNGLAALRQAASASQLMARVDDVRFALDEVARRATGGQAPWHRLARQPVGVCGHSFGAVTVLALAGLHGRAGSALRDDRPAAFIALSPQRRPGQEGEAVRRPLLVATGSLDLDPLSAEAGFDPARDRAGVYDQLPSGQRGLLWLQDADHATFGGGTGERRQGRWRQRPEAALDTEPAHQSLVAEATTLWWQAQLLGAPAARQRLARPAADLPLAAGDRWRFD